MDSEKVVQRKQFVNVRESEINEFLRGVSAEDIISTHFHVLGYGPFDEYTTIFYKTSV